MILFYKISLFNIKKIESLYKLSLCISVRGCGQVDKNDLDHIICKVRVITRLKDLNSWAHSGKHTGSQSSCHCSILPPCLLKDKHNVPKA